MCASSRSGAGQGAALEVRWRVAGRDSFRAELGRAALKGAARDYLRVRRAALRGRLLMEIVALPAADRGRVGDALALASRLYAGTGGEQAAWRCRHAMTAGPRTCTRPLSITTAPSCLVVWKNAVSPSPARSSASQIETVSRSPGSTGRLNRPDIDRNLAGSEPHTACSTARRVEVILHKHCSMGRLIPPLFTN